MQNEIKTFLDSEGRLTQFPAKRKKKIITLFYLAEKIEANRQYSEKEINELLCLWHTFSDQATLRRELFDYGFITRSRDGRIYELSDPQPTREELIP